MQPRRVFGIVYPRSGGMRTGNRTSALRWAAILRQLGWRPFLSEEWIDRPTDGLLAVHAIKTATSIRRFAERRPDAPLIVAAAGTDLYSDSDIHPTALASFRLATRIVVLQDLAIDALPAELRGRARVMHQSVNAAARAVEPDADQFRVCVVANLRAVKDPLCAAEASRLLPAESRVSVRLIGAEVDEDLASSARREAETNTRFRWLGELARREAMAEISRAQLLISTSRHEGGANVITEALALDVPVVASDIPGSRGLLGEDYPGLFPAGDRPALAAMIGRAETEPDFRETLKTSCRKRAWIASPERELEAWRSLIGELFDTGVVR